jgi:hypothetical protein
MNRLRNYYLGHFTDVVMVIPTCWRQSGWAARLFRRDDQDIADPHPQRLRTKEITNYIRFEKQRSLTNSENIPLSDYRLRKRRLCNARTLRAV